MKLSLPFLTTKKKEVKDYFLALLLRDEHVRAIVFSQIDGKIAIKGDASVPLETSLEKISTEKLLETLDKAIGQAESTLPENIETHKTIFGLKDSWVEGTTIRKERMDRLKEVCQQLDLQPIGFLVFQEAIAHLLQKEEGAPVSAILVEAEDTLATVSLLRAGRIVEVQSGVLGDSIAQTIENFLQGFQNAEILPSRIIVLDMQDRPQLSQKLLKHSWKSNIPFLHVPQVTMLGNEFDARAILYGTASQMGFDAQDLPKMKPQAKQAIEEIPPLEEAKPSYAEATAGEEEPEEIEEKPDELEERKDKEIAELPTIEEAETQLSMEKEVGAEDLGFVMGKDVLEEAPEKIHAAKNFASENIQEIPEEVKMEEEGLIGGIGGLNATAITEGMQNVFSSIKKNLKMPTVSSKPLLLIPLILLVLIATVLWYIFGLSATVTLTMNAKKVDQSQTITFVPNAPSNFSQNLLGSATVSVSEDGSVSADATGKKDVGDKAKGTVTVFNNDSDSHTLAAGTTITAQNGLKFVTASDITVASASGDIFSGTTPGKQDVAVTAADIGTEYNFPSGTKFAIGSSLVLAAKNNSAFSGGSKKTITVVSQDDLDNLTKSLSDKLQDKAKSDILQKSSNTQAVLPLFLKTDLTKKNFSKQAGDEATSVSLDGTIAYTTLTYAKSDLDSFAKQLLQDKIPSNTQLDQNGLQENITDASVQKDNSVKATATVHASLLPTLDNNQAARAIAGKSYTDIKSALNLPDLLSAQVTLSPNLFFLPHNLPRLSSHIKIIVTGNE